MVNVECYKHNTPIFTVQKYSLVIVLFSIFQNTYGSLRAPGERSFVWGGYGPRMTHAQHLRGGSHPRPTLCVAAQHAVCRFSVWAAGGPGQKVARRAPCACPGGAFGRGNMTWPRVRCEERAGAPGACCTDWPAARLQPRPLNPLACPL